MRRDPTEFRQRFQAYKEGKMPYKNGLPKYKGGKSGLTVEQEAALDDMYSYFAPRGYDIVSISGMGGNGIQESGLNPNAVSKSGYAGVWQNSKALQNAIVDMYGDHSKSNQYKYADAWVSGDKQVRKGKHAAHTAMGSGKFKKSGYKTAEEAADAWLRNYERAVILDKAGKVIGYQDEGKRKAYAKNAYDYLYNKYGGALKANIVPAQVVAPVDATAVRQTIPAEQTRAKWEGAENVSPYLTGKPQLILRPEINIPNIKDPIQKYESWFEKRPLLSYVMSQDEQSEDDGLLYAKNGKLPGYEDGKSPIHIKPANRGKFTALKKRTGHSASWFKENGTPAQKKMAVFALNAKKWHHADGKLPEYGGGLTPVAMPAQAAQNNNVVNGIMSYIPFVGTAMDGNDLIQGDARAAIPFLIGTVADTVGGRSLYKAYQARKIFMDAVKQKLSTSQVYPLMIQANDKMNKALAGAAAYASDWYENTLQNLRK